MFVEKTQVNNVKVTIIHRIAVAECLRSANFARVDKCKVQHKKHTKLTAFLELKNEHFIMHFYDSLSRSKTW